MGTMKVFISWSGSRSRGVAEALRAWLPSVLQALEPWLSAADIQAGSRWHYELGSCLASSSFGIICMTPENQGSRWLLYEAGALSRSVDGSRVVPYLIGMEKPDIEGPLSHFQAVESNEEGTFELLQSLNGALSASGERALSEAGLKRAYEVWWPELESSLQSVRATSQDLRENSPSEEGRLLETLLKVVSDYRVVLGKLHATQERESRDGAEGARA